MDLLFYTISPCLIFHLHIKVTFLLFNRNVYFPLLSLFSLFPLLELPFLSSCLSLTSHLFCTLPCSPSPLYIFLSPSFPSYIFFLFFSLLPPLIPFPSLLQAVTDLVDSALPSVCHSRPLPCPASDTSISDTSNVLEDSKTSNSNKDGVGVGAEAEARGAAVVKKGSADKTCLTPQLLTGLLREADKDFCLRYTGSNGGRNATQLSTYSFMKEVILILSCLSCLVLSCLVLSCRRRIVIIITSV